MLTGSAVHAPLTTDCPRPVLNQRRGRANTTAVKYPVRLQSVHTRHPQPAHNRRLLIGSRLLVAHQPTSFTRQPPSAIHQSRSQPSLDACHAPSAHHPPPHFLANTQCPPSAGHPTLSVPCSPMRALLGAGGVDSAPWPYPSSRPLPCMETCGVLARKSKHTAAQQKPRQWSVVPQAPFGSAVTSGWLNWTCREHGVKPTPCLFPQAIARARQVLHLKFLNPAKPPPLAHKKRPHSHGGPWAWGEGGGMVRAVLTKKPIWVLKGAVGNMYAITG